MVAKRSERETAGVCVAEGARVIATALGSGAEVLVLYVGPGAQAHEDIVGRARDAGVRVEHLDARALERATDTVTPQRLVAVVRAPRHRLADIDPSLVVVVAGVGDPGNAGTIIRVAEAAGATAVVFGARSVDAFSPKVVRASAGAVFQIPIVQGATTLEVLDELAQRGVRRLGTAAVGGTAYEEVDWSGASALVLGNEAAGLPDDLRTSVDEWVTIPMPGRSESLNVAMAAAVLLFEAARQRRRSEA